MTRAPTKLVTVGEYEITPAGMGKARTYAVRWYGEELLATDPNGFRTWTVPTLKEAEQLVRDHKAARADEKETGRTDR